MKPSVHISLVAAAARAIAAIAASGNCACGYVDSSGNVWREAIVSDFTSQSGALPVVKKNWAIQTWTSDPSPGQLPMQNVVKNVFQYQDALGLKTSAYDNSGTTKVSEIDTKRSDILYGSFRMRAQVPSVPGVCFGFFSYKNDTEEIDIEFLSSDADYYRHAHYTNQPGSLPNGDDDPQSYHQKTITGADFTAFNEHRFDWLPGRCNFFLNGKRIDTLTKNVPTVPSQIMVNVWSNGDQYWSLGPPKKDAIATIQYIKLYFNGTTYNDAAFRKACQATKVPRCKI